MLQCPKEICHRNQILQSQEQNRWRRLKVLLEVQFQKWPASWLRANYSSKSRKKFLKTSFFRERFVQSCMKTKLSMTEKLVLQNFQVSLNRLQHFSLMYEYYDCSCLENRCNFSKPSDKCSPRIFNQILFERKSVSQMLCLSKPRWEFFLNISCHYVLLLPFASIFSEHPYTNNYSSLSILTVMKQFSVTQPSKVIPINKSLHYSIAQTSPQLFYFLLPRSSTDILVTHSPFD